MPVISPLYLPYGGVPIRLGESTIYSNEMYISNNREGYFRINHINLNCCGSAAFYHTGSFQADTLLQVLDIARKSVVFLHQDNNNQVVPTLAAQIDAINKKNKDYQIKLHVLEESRILSMLLILEKT